MSECIFCNIINKELPSSVVFENDKVLGFKDIDPSAKVHLLFIHKNHSENVNDMVRTDATQVSDVYQAIEQYTAGNSLAADGFRVVTNIGKHGRQDVFHTHFHVLGGEKLTGNLGN